MAKRNTILLYLISSAVMGLAGSLAVDYVNNYSFGWTDIGAMLTSVAIAMSLGYFSGQFKD